VNSDTETVSRLRATIVDAGTGVFYVGADVWPLQSPYTLSASGSGLCADKAAQPGQACLLSGTRNRGVWEFAFPVPAHLPARKFNQLAFNLSDSASNQNYVEAVGPLKVSFSTVSTQPDSKAPTVRSVTASIPATVDARDFSEYQIHLDVSDNLSGVRAVSASFRSSTCLTPTQMQTKLCQNASSDSDWRRVSFTPTDLGDFVGYLQISESMFNGRWRLFSINVQDQVGNTREMWGNALTSFNPPSFVLRNGLATKISDATAPTITAVSIAPKTVNSANAAAIATVTIKATDNVGVAMVWASVVGPNSYVSEPEMSCVLSSGTTKNGVWKCGVRIPIHGSSGKWRVVFLARDAANNDANLVPAVEQLVNNDGYFITNG